MHLSGLSVVLFHTRTYLVPLACRCSALLLLLLLLLLRSAPYVAVCADRSLEASSTRAVGSHSEKRNVSARFAFLLRDVTDLPRIYLVYNMQCECQIFCMLLADMLLLRFVRSPRCVTRYQVPGIHQGATKRATNPRGKNIPVGGGLSRRIRPG